MKEANSISEYKNTKCGYFLCTLASRTNFFPVDEKSMQKNPRLRPALLKFIQRRIIAFRTGQGRF
jgi:hypothetical protein